MSDEWVRVSAVLDNGRGGVEVWPAVETAPEGVRATKPAYAG